MKHLNLLKSFLLLCALVVGSSSVWAEDADVTYNIADDFTVSEGALTDGTVSFSGSGPNNFKMNTGYFMMGKSGAYINFPAYTNPVKKIVVTGNSGASASTTMNIYVGETAVSTETTGSQGTNTYEIASGYQSAGTIYTLKVTSNHNAQITKIEVFYASSGSTLADNDLALTDAPIALNFDMYNNSAAQTIHYTTTSTGAVTVSASDYVSTVVDAENKTITVTPTKKTPSAQTITVSQAADATYKLGSATFTVTIDDSTPKIFTWAATDLEDLNAGDIFVIVGNNGSNNYAMSNDNGTSSAPSAVEVTISDDEITSDVADQIQWNISGNATDGYTFYPNGSTTTWLYCTDTNNGVRVGTNASKTFGIEDSYLYHKGTSRYVGIYNSQDWRCYTSINANIKDETFAFYRKVVPATVSYADGWMSYVTPSAITFPENVEAYVVTALTPSLTREKITSAPAGTPVVLHATEGAKTYALPVAASATAPAANELNVSDGTVTGNGKIYVLTVKGAQAGFAPLKTGSTLSAGKVYIEFAEAPAKDFIGFDDGETTSIESIHNSQFTIHTDAPMFNLSGQRVSESYKGIVIVNGKKVIRK